MKMSDADEKMLVDLWKLHLRHPGMVKPAIAKLCKQKTLTDPEIARARTELHALTKGANI